MQEAKQKSCKLLKTNGGVEEGRTPDLCIANAALCQTELLPQIPEFEDKNPGESCQVKLSLKSQVTSLKF